MKNVTGPAPRRCAPLPPVASLPAPRPVSETVYDTEPLSPAAATALTRLELALADTVVATFDNHGSFWGFETVAETETSIAEERANGTTIDEWETVDRDGQPLRVVRITDPTFLDTISVFSAWDTTTKAVA